MFTGVVGRFGSGFRRTQQTAARACCSGCPHGKGTCGRKINSIVSKRNMVPLTSFTPLPLCWFQVKSPNIPTALIKGHFLICSAKIQIRSNPCGCRKHGTCLSIRLNTNPYDSTLHAFCQEAVPCLQIFHNAFDALICDTHALNMP